MDPKVPRPMMMAHGDPWPPVDDHLVEPEVTRDEMIRGRKVVAAPVQAPHADQQARRAYVVQAHVRPGYVVAMELLTRMAPGSDFATDVCIRRAGTDPKTGRRYLEEVAFEVVSEQSHRDIREKAEDMEARGVRRVFGIFIETGEVKEWRGGWQTLPPDSHIDDGTLSRPLPLVAILDPAAADMAVVQALLNKNNPALALG